MSDLTERKVSLEVTPDKRSKRKLTYTYDGLGRVAKRIFQANDYYGSQIAFQSEYSYLAGGHGAGSTTTLVRAIQQAGNRHEYQYDAHGNITQERRQGKAPIVGQKTNTRYPAVDVEGKRLTTDADGELTANVERTIWPLLPMSFDDKKNESWKIGFEEKPLAGTSGETVNAYVEVPVRRSLISEENKTLAASTENMGEWCDTTYAYDALGQLTRINDDKEQSTWTYKYDRGGNILEKRQFVYTTAREPHYMDLRKIIPYTYGDGNWKDKLTAYDGKAITYDAIGNPRSYDGWAYTWKAGRMLARMTKGGVNPVDAFFTYDHTGLRVRKVAKGVATLYTLNGTKITHIRKTTALLNDPNALINANGPGSPNMHFFYDAQGRAAIVRYNEVDYAYLHNLQGDVTGLVDMRGNTVVQYAYDAWGKPVATEGSMADTLGYDNPFRYRGYVWDEETGLYYLRSRYYNPEWGGS